MIKFLDLGKVNNRYREEIDERIAKILDNGWYLQGKENEIFTQNLANFCGAKYCVGVANGLDALNLIIKGYGFGAGDEIIVPANTYIASILAISENGCTPVLVEPDINTYNINSDLIEEKITDKTKIVGITHISNVLGTINNIKKIIKYAHKKGAIIIVDASQSIPHFKVDVQDLNADFVVFSGHKMLAPLGIGVLYGKKELLQKMNPFLMGGDMIEYVYEQETTFAPLPNKFEAGTQNVEGVVGLGAAIDYINEIGYENIEKEEKELTEYARKELEKLDFLDLYLTPNKENHSSVFSFNIKGIHPHDVASILDTEGVYVRSGNHCAQPLLRYLGIDSTCRASLYFYNTKEEIDKLVKALIKTNNIFARFKK